MTARNNTQHAGNSADGSAWQQLAPNELDLNVRFQIRGHGHPDGVLYPYSVAYLRTLQQPVAIGRVVDLRVGRYDGVMSVISALTGNPLFVSESEDATGADRLIVVPSPS